MLAAPPAPAMPFPDLTPERARQVIEAAYTFRPDAAAWADGLHQALGPALDLGLGTLVGLVRFDEGGLGLTHLSGRAGISRVHPALVRLSLLLAPGKMREAFFNGRVLGSSSGHHAREHQALLEERARSARARDAAGFCVNDAVDQGVMVISPSRERLLLPARTAPEVLSLGEHVSTGLRLQRVLSGATLEDPAIEAIFEPSGRAQRAAGMARMQSALEHLRERVRARDRRPAVGEAASAWEAVVAGRWSLIDRFDSDGRRYVVAYRNPPGLLDPRRLTAREEAVTTLAAVGRSNAEIAAALSLTEEGASEQLKTALVKLGLSSRTLLPIFWRDLQGRPWVISEREASLVALSRQADPEGGASLTATERAVANGLLAGLSEQEIARARGSSRRAVARHSRSVFHKLGVNSRAELAAKCDRLPGCRVEG
jgi:DNA-binding NarL/FixJ family response regulator